MNEIDKNEITYSYLGQGNASAELLFLTLDLCVYVLYLK